MTTGTPRTSGSVKSYRPLTVLTFRVNFALHGLDVRGYHIVNVLLHGLCTVLVGHVAHDVLAPRDALVAWVAALAFAVHPVHVEAVASIVGRAELLCCCFYLLAVWCHAVACRPGRGALCGTAWWLASACLVVLASTSKETGITAAVVCVGLDCAYALPRATPMRARVLCAVRGAASAALVAVLLYGSRVLRGDDLSPHFSFVDNPLPSLPDSTSRVLSALHIHVRYARLLLWPSTLSADYSFDCVPALTSPADWRLAPIVALYLGLGALGVRALLTARRGAHDDPAVSAGRAVLLLIAPMVPASHLLVGIGTLVAERLLYTPSVGLALLVGLAASSLVRVARGVRATWSRRGLHIALLSAAALALALAANRTWRRNEDWRSSDAITIATAAACPASAKAHVSLGTMHLQHDDRAAARASFRAALRIHPQYSDALYWLGRVAFIEGRLDEAESLLTATLQLNAAHPEAHLFAALCAARRADDAAALALFERAHELAPHNAEIVRDLGAMLLRAGRPERGLGHLQRAVDMLAQLRELGRDDSPHARSSLASAQVKLAAALLASNRHGECIATARAAAALEPAVAPHVEGLLGLCQRALRERMDTSQVRLDIGL